MEQFFNPEPPLLDKTNNLGQIELNISLLTYNFCFVWKTCLIVFGFIIVSFKMIGFNITYLITRL